MITSKCTLTIDLDIIKKNYQNLQKICSESEVGAAVKANCYGLGVLHITPVLGKYGCRHFFVANQDEGVSLRKILNQQNLSSEFTNIYVLKGYFVGDKDDFLEPDLPNRPSQFVLVQTTFFTKFLLKIRLIHKKQISQQR